jgi:hypothetical protein
MPQNKFIPFVNTRHKLTATGVIKAKPGTVVSVYCTVGGTLNLINDTTSGGAGASINGFPATLTAGQTLPLNSSASVGIAVKAVTGTWEVRFT